MVCMQVVGVVIAWFVCFLGGFSFSYVNDVFLFEHGGSSFLYQMLIFFILFAVRYCTKC